MAFVLHILGVAVFFASITLSIFIVDRIVDHQPARPVVFEAECINKVDNTSGKIRRYGKYLIVYRNHLRGEIGLAECDASDWGLLKTGDQVIIFHNGLRDFKVIPQEVPSRD